LSLSGTKADSIFYHFRLHSDQHFSPAGFSRDASPPPALLQHSGYPAFAIISAKAEIQNTC